MNLIETAAAERAGAVAPLELVTAQQPASCWIDAAVVGFREIAAAERATAHKAAAFAAQQLMRAHGFGGHSVDAGVASGLNGSGDRLSFSELTSILSAAL
jgi:hypothetical protein